MNVVKSELVVFSSNGQRIFGNLHLPNMGSPCIVTLHGLESSKDSGKWPTIASRFYGEGYACLRFSFRGCGEGSEKSDGEFEELSLTGRIEDYRSALRFLQDSGKVDMARLGVIGSSLGGMVAAAARDDRVKAMVTMGTPYKIPRFEKPLIPKDVGDCYKLPSGKRFKKGFYEDLRRYDILEAVRSVPSIFIVHGSLDETVPLDHARKLYEAASDPKRLELVEGAGHVFSQREHLDKVIYLIMEWFGKYL